MSSSEEEVEEKVVDVLEIKTYELLAEAFNETNAIFGHPYSKNTTNAKASKLSGEEKMEKLIGMSAGDGGTVAETNAVTSHKDAMDNLIVKMKKYYFNPTYKIGGARNNITALGKHMDRLHNKTMNYVKGHSGLQSLKQNNLIYCGECLKNEARPDGIYFCVLASVNYMETKYGEDKFRACVYATEIYPHNRQCCVKPSKRDHWEFDKFHGGSGLYHHRNFPQHLIFGDIFHGIEEDFDKLKRGDEHPGLRIDNGTKRGSGEYPFDYRYQMKLLEPSDEQKEFFGLGKDFERKLRFSNLRLSLWLGNTFNASSEFFGKCVSKQTIGKPPFPHGSDSDKHLTVSNNALLFGGHKKGDKLVHQTPHFDLQKVTNADGKEYAVSMNPLLRGKFKPGSLMFCLKKKTSRYIYSLNASKEIGIHKVRYGNALYFSGDTSHGGVTYDEDDSNFSWHLSVHVNILSSYHDVPLEDFDVDCEGIANAMPDHIPLLTVDNQVNAVKPHIGIVKSIFKEGLKNNGGTKSIKTQIQSLRDFCDRLLSGDTDEDDSGAESMSGENSRTTTSRVVGRGEDEKVVAKRKREKGDHDTGGNTAKRSRRND